MQNALEIILPRLMQQAKIDQIDRLVVGAVISKSAGTKVLCLKRAGHDFMPGLYELPSGKVGEEEAIYSALLREIHEETHLTDIRVTDYLSSFDYRSQSGRLTRQLNFIVQCDNIHSLALNDNEHEGYTWLTVNELSKYNISNETQKVIRAYFLRQNAKLSPTQQMIDAWQQGVEGLVVGGVLSHNEKVLLLKRGNSEFSGGTYELLGGMVNNGESLEMSLERCVKQETDLELKSIDNPLVYFDYRSNSGQLIRQFNFQISVNNATNVRLSSEHEGFSWVHGIELNTYPISKEVKAVLEEVLPKKSSLPTNPLIDQGWFKKKRDRDDDKDQNSTNLKKSNFAENTL